MCFLVCYVPRIISVMLKWCIMHKIISPPPLLPVLNAAMQNLTACETKSLARREIGTHRNKNRRRQRLTTQDEKQLNWIFVSYCRHEHNEGDCHFAGGCGISSGRPRSEQARCQLRRSLAQAAARGRSRGHGQGQSWRLVRYSSVLWPTRPHTVQEAKVFQASIFPISYFEFLIILWSFLFCFIGGCPE